MSLSEESLRSMLCEFPLSDSCRCDECKATAGDCYFLSDGGHEPRDGMHLCRRCLDVICQGGEDFWPDAVDASIGHPAVYVASRASIPERSQMWRDLRAGGWNITSTWIDEAGEGETEDLTELWDRIEEEIRSADGLILFAHGSDFPLKGAIVEAGMAIGMGKHVAIVLVDCELEKRSMRPLGSWAAHPRCVLCESLDEALESIARLS